MSQPVIKVEGLSKRYKLGVTHAGSIRELVNRTAARLAGCKSTNGTRSPAAEHADRVDDDGHFWALKDIDFEVQPGEVVGIIGKNGAGKSTLLKIFSRITHPTTGRVELHGRVASLLEVGTGFHPELTGRENVYLNGTILGMTKAEVDRQFDAIVDFAGVEKFIDTPVKRYSSGMTVRLGFAVAAHLDPEILIVDEVLAVGDVEFQRRCIGKMQSVAESGRTVLFVSHNLASVRQLTTRCIVLADGTLTFRGTTRNALQHYLATCAALAIESQPITSKDRQFSGLSREVEFVELRLNRSAEYSLLDASVLPVRLLVRSRESVEGFVIGLTVFSEEKLPIGSTFSRKVDAPPKGRSMTLDVGVPITHLAPGHYYCGISLSDPRSGRAHLWDSLTDVLHFTIEHSESAERPWVKGWGPMQLAELTVTGVNTAATPPQSRDTVLIGKNAVG